jgi:hypothetical protein
VAALAQQVRKVLLGHKDSLLQVLVVLQVLQVQLVHKVLVVYMVQLVLLGLREFQPHKVELAPLVCMDQQVLLALQAQLARQELLVH